MKQNFTYAVPAIDLPFKRSLRDSTGYSRGEFLFDMEGEMDARQLYRRLKHAFVQEPARRITVVVDEWWEITDRGVYAKLFKERNTARVSVEGRITRRKHSHDRSWGEKYRPWSGWVSSSVGRLDGDDHWAADGFYAVREMNVVPARKSDWAVLRRLNASRPEPTIASIAPRNISEKIV